MPPMERFAGTIDLGGAPEQAATDGKGRIYIDLEDKDAIAVVDTKTLAVTAKYDIAGKGGQCAGLAMDQKNRILFAACRNPAAMVILGADDGKVITTLPIEGGTDGAGFNASSMEAFSSAGNGTLTVVKEQPHEFRGGADCSDNVRGEDHDAGYKEQSGAPLHGRGIWSASDSCCGAGCASCRGARCIRWTRRWRPGPGSQTRSDAAGFVYDSGCRKVNNSAP